ncbi:acyltransferase family protein [Hymenobacter sp. BT507]|uniref:Acyltransferase family protein n=1 Tax=Hymenobacter citatus TaxID=2763506 RepID=A0ABR7MN22_9BACT|nr:acyltransferase family protein [Hymenobacter citatus]MBC6612482.1 acyltransferase family protein [Hymenobacter citatus]
MNERQKRNYAIDIFRLLGALSVVALHVPYEDLTNSLVLGIRWWGRWAVPFFFLLSGYFFQRNYRERGNIQFVKTIKNLLSVYVVSNIIYIAFDLFINKSHTLNEFLNFHDLDNGVSGHLWFVGSMIFGYLALLYSLESFSNISLLLISITIYIVVVTLDVYSIYMQMKLNHDFARYFISIPFLIWGVLIAKSSNVINKISIYVFGLLVLLTFLVQCVEMVLAYKGTGYSPHNIEFVLSSSLFALSMFGLSLRIKLDKDVLIARLGRKYSLLIYLYHPMLNIYLFKFLNMKNLGGGYLMLLNPLISFLFCVILFVFIDRLYPKAINFLSGT